MGDRTAKTRQRAIFRSRCGTAPGVSPAGPFCCTRNRGLAIRSSFAATFGVAARGARVILEVQAPLRRLMGVLADPVQIVSERRNAATVRSALPAAQCAVCFRHHACDHSGNSAVSRRIRGGGLQNGTAGSAWKQRPRIGLAWSGRPTHKNDHNRSIAPQPVPVRCLRTSTRIFVSLQREVRNGRHQRAAGAGAISFISARS